MRHTFCLAALVAVAVLLLAPEFARAEGLSACGNISVGLSAQCEVQPPGVSCETMCAAPRMEVSCAADLTVSCAPQCTQTVEEQLVTVCSNNCVTQCEANPGSFSCSGTCGANCAADCQTQCGTSSQCLASCKASCSFYCDGGCKVVLPSMTCQEKCAPSCHSQVEAKVKTQCQLQCQAKEIVTCQEKMVQDCKTQCRLQEGALFCDGQFVDADNNLQDCIDALKNLKITVKGGISVEVSGCSMNGGRAAGAGTLLLLALVPLVARRRSRR